MKSILDFELVSHSARRWIVRAMLASGVFLTLHQTQATAQTPANPPAAGHDMLLDPNPAPTTLRVALPELAAGAIPQDSALSGFGCTGHNRSPHIIWTNVPTGTRSFALVVHDPDAPTGVGFFHWTVVNIPAATTSLPLDASHAGLPTGAVQASTDFGALGYGGPCPSVGEDHRYIFTVYALDVPHLEIPVNATGAMIRFFVRGHTLALGRAIGTYRRP